MQSSAAEDDEITQMVFIEKDSFRNLRRLPTDAFRPIPRLSREDLVLPVAASDLVAWYPFRQGTGVDVTAGDSNFGDTTDYSAVVNGASFQASGGVTDIQTGANSGAFDLDGTDDTLDLGTVADSDQSLTFMAWVNLDSVSKDFQRIIAKEEVVDVQSGDIAIGNNDSGKFRTFAVHSSSFTLVTGSTVASADTYFHVASRFDFSTDSLSLFVNGQPEGTKTTGQLQPNATRPWVIGAGTGGSPLKLDGTADDARIYTTALSDSQINQIYLNTQP